MPGVVHPSAILPGMQRPLRLAAVVSVVIGFVSVCWWTIATPYAQGNIVTEFKYGSIGTEGNVGVPYWIFKVLPEVFADKLPNRPGSGWARLGFIYETPAS